MVTRVQKERYLTVFCYSYCICYMPIAFKNTLTGIVREVLMKSNDLSKYFRLDKNSSPKLFIISNKQDLIN